MRKEIADDMGQLLDIIGAGSFNDKGPIVVEVEVWNGKKIEAVYANKPNQKFLVGDVETNFDIFVDVNPIRNFVQRLFETGKSFFAVYGSDDSVCSLEWRIAS